MHGHCCSLLLTRNGLTAPAACTGAVVPAALGGVADDREEDVFEEGLLLDVLDLIDSRTSAACAATSKPLTRAVPPSAFSSVERIFTTVVLPALFEPSNAKKLPLGTSKSTPRCPAACAVT
jgi:hypothetical protein